MIGDMLREMESPHEKKKWFMKWDETFKADNPRYQPDKFFEFVHPKVAQAAQELADELR